MSAPRSPSYFSRLVSTPADRGAPPPLLPPRLLFRPAAPLVPGMEAAPGGPAIGAASRAPRPPARPVLDRLPAGEDAASYDDGGRQGGGPQPPPEDATTALRSAPETAGVRPAGTMPQPMAEPAGAEYSSFGPAPAPRRVPPPHPFGDARAHASAETGSRPPAAAAAGGIGPAGPRGPEPAAPIELPRPEPPRRPASERLRPQPLPGRAQPPARLSPQAAASPAAERVRIGTLEVRVAAPQPPPIPTAAAPRRAAASPPARIARPFAGFGFGQS